jgi:deoxyribonuclease V
VVGASLEPELVAINGLVDPDPNEAPGLVRHVFERCRRHRRLKVLESGLAAPFGVFLEEGSRPLLVTSVGIDLGAAKAGLRAMRSRKQVPTLLKLLARAAKGAVA